MIKVIISKPNTDGVSQVTLYVDGEHVSSLRANNIQIASSEPDLEPVDTVVWCEVGDQVVSYWCDEVDDQRGAREAVPC